jgi:hypothetical protein
VVASLAARHAITVELRAGAPLGLVALVTLPHSVLEPRAAAAPQSPVYVPDVDDQGTPEPLGARRVAWRPADEPPVEEWRRADLDAQAEPNAEPPLEPPLEPSPFAEQTNASAPYAETFTSPPPAEPFESTAPNEEPSSEQAPLATRIPGQHLSHEPHAEVGDDTDEADPLRPYRVHELLTRHAQGKRRGRAEQEQPEEDATDGRGWEDPR